MSEKPTAIRGPVLTLTGDPFKNGLDHTTVYEIRCHVVMNNGLITHFGPADTTRLVADQLVSQSSHLFARLQPAC